MIARSTGWNATFQSRPTAATRIPSGGHDHRDQRHDLADPARARREPCRADGLSAERRRGRELRTWSTNLRSSANNGCADSDHRRRNRRSRCGVRALARARGRALRARSARRRAREHGRPRRARARHRVPRPQHPELPAALPALRRARRADARLGDVVLGQLRRTAGSSTRAAGRSRSSGTRRARASTRCSGRSAAGCAPRGRSLDEADYESASLGDYLDARGYSRRFRSHFLVPLTAALWSTAPGRALEFPAAYAIRFFENHGMLGFGRFHWRTVTGGSRVYVVGDRRAARAGGCGSASPVRSIRRTADGVELRAADGERASGSTRSWSRRTPTRRSRCSRIRATRSGARSAGSPTRSTTPCCTPTRRSCRARGRRAPRGTTAPATTGGRR